MKQVEKFKYFGVALTSDGRQDKQLDLNTQIGKASAVMRALHYSVVMKRELSKTQSSQFSKQSLSPFSLIVINGKCLVNDRRVRSQVQASEMRFLRRIERVRLFNMVRISEIQKPLNIKQLLLRIERSQLRWFGM